MHAVSFIRIQNQVYYEGEHNKYPLESQLSVDKYYHKTQHISNISFRVLARIRMIYLLPF